MSCYVRMMQREDISQVAEIDREAFPTMLPPPNYANELQNRLAHYIVVCDDGDETEGQEPPGPDGEQPEGFWTFLKRIFTRSEAQLFNRQRISGHRIVGFLGCWILSDEAHITSIAVRESDQRRGIGEMLIISSVELAMKLYSTILTLEVRVSNTGAQALYSKYGFKKVGVRKGYYTDNREDAVIMSTPSIHSARYKRTFHRLKENHRIRSGAPVREA